MSLEGFLHPQELKFTVKVKQSDKLYFGFMQCFKMLIWVIHNFNEKILKATTFHLLNVAMKHCQKRHMAMWCYCEQTIRLWQWIRFCHRTKYNNRLAMPIWTGHTEWESAAWTGSSEEENNDNIVFHWNADRIGNAIWLIATYTTIPIRWHLKQYLKQNTVLLLEPGIFAVVQLLLYAL